LREDKDSRIRGTAAFGIYRISSDLTRHGRHATEVLDALIPSLDDPDPLVRMDVALALGTLEADAKDAVPGLQAGIKRKDNKVKVLTFPLTIREQMIIALGFVGPDAKDALGLLEEALRDDEETTRNHAARSLGKLGPTAKHAVPLLIEIINNEAEAEFVQETAREAVMLIAPEMAAKLANK
jgi:HEAT repeat protein